MHTIQEFLPLHFVLTKWSLLSRPVRDMVYKADSDAESSSLKKITLHKSILKKMMSCPNEGLGIAEHVWGKLGSSNEEAFKSRLQRVFLRHCDFNENPLRVNEDKFIEFYCFKASGGVDEEGHRNEYSFVPLFCPMVNKSVYSSLCSSNVMVTAVANLN
mmetsp:Transcript_5370/g.9015  ORF Transcript_5370/g.9015 Transcript_5370/m.9015 type:complete len:159 (+) Transcript_5370:67-543(+)